MGYWKGDFLAYTLGFAHLQKKTCTIVLACAVLHNIGIDRNDILDVDEECINHGDMSFDVTDQRDGKNVRNYICMWGVLFINM